MDNKQFVAGFWVNNKKIQSFPTIVLVMLFCASINLVFIKETRATASPISLSAPSNISIELEPSAEGVFATSDTSTHNISITTDNYTGYTLGIAASTDNANNSLKNLDDNDELIDSISAISSPVSAEDFASNNNANTYNNTWGLRPSKYDSEDNTINNYYYPAPTSTTMTVLDETSSANTTANTYNLAVGVRATSDKAPGEYTGIIVITAIANAAAYSISYNDPSGEATNMPANTSGSTYDETVRISTTRPARTDYRFDGWCTVSVADNASCTGTTYRVSSNYTLDQTTASNHLTLYAMWSKPYKIIYNGNNATAGEMPNQDLGYYPTSVTLQAYNYQKTGYGFAGWSENPNAVVGTDKIFGPMEDVEVSDFSAAAQESRDLNLYAVWLPKSTTYNMQNFSATTCSSELTSVVYNSNDASFTVAQNSLIALEDTRDGNVYTIARMPDSHCWMLENLRLDDSATLSSDNTNSPAAGFTNLSASSDSWCRTNNSDCIDRSLFNKNNTDINNTNLAVSYDGYVELSKWYGYGNYYNWYSATAGNGTYSKTSGSVSGDICPKNWGLPIGDSYTSDRSFGKLSSSMGGAERPMSDDSTPTGTVMSIRIRQFPVNFLYSGGKQGDRGNAGIYWSATTTDNKSAGYLFLETSSVVPNATGSKYFGVSVRCVAK